MVCRFVFRDATYRTSGTSGAFDENSKLRNVKTIETGNDHSRERQTQDAHGATLTDVGVSRGQTSASGGDSAQEGNVNCSMHECIL